MKYWLMKSEPGVYSIDTLQREGQTLWEGVRNYQARNFMMKDMKVGDMVLFYHSNAEPSGVAGLAQVSSPAVADPSQFKRRSKSYDAKSSTESPRWFCVSVRFVKKFERFVSLAQLRQTPGLAAMRLLQKGQRLSIMPVTGQEFERICSLASTAPRP
ncbi:MAG: EVE domain-containing protein [Bdellovibrio sp.]|nr:MAG: EVE domain-containing protein [Bdellovibrio sp.]